MISDELNVYGFIKVPFPFLQDYLVKIESLKQKTPFKNFPDFIMPPINCIGNAVAPFAYVFRYEPEFEKILIERFELFINEIKFLFASIIIDIESREYYFYEYVYVHDGPIHKSSNKVINQEN